MRFAVALTTVCLTACATQKAAETKKSNEPERLSVSQVMFDTAACAPRAMTVSPTANTEAVLASLLMARPMLTECFISPANRGPALDTTATAKVTIGEGGAKTSITGTNLTASGTTCLEGALKQLTFPPLGKGEKELTVELPLSHGAGSPAVKLGLNIASDIVGGIRAVQTSWCDCFKAVGTTPPPTIAAAIKLAPPAPPEDKDKDKKDEEKKDKKADKDAPPAPLGPPTVEVVMKAPAGEASAALSACLEPRLKATAFPPVPAELRVTYAFLLINSYADKETAESEPALQFLQLDAIRGQKAADVVAAASRKTTAAMEFDAAVKRYQATKDFKMVKELKEKCGVVLAADDGWIASLTSLLDVDKKSLAVVQTLKAKDPMGWAAAEAGLNSRVAETTEQLPKAQKIRAGDSDACPKVK